MKFAAIVSKAFGKSLSSAFSTMIGAIKRVVTGNSPIEGAGARELFDAGKTSIMKAMRVKLVDTTKELQGISEKSAVVQASVLAAEAEMGLAEVQAEKMFIEAQEQMVATKEAASQGGVDMLSQDAVGKKDAAKAMMCSVQKVVMLKLEEESKLLQHRYEVEQTKFLTELQAVKEEDDAAFCKALEIRQPCAALESAEERSLEVHLLVQKYKAEHQKAAMLAMAEAEAARAKAEEITKIAEAAALHASQKRSELQGVRQLEEKRRKEAHQTPADAQSTLEHAKQLASTMVASGSLDLGALQEAAMGAAFVWGWTEDVARYCAHPEERRKHGSESDPIVLYSQTVWAKVEAHLLAVTAGAESKYSVVQVDVGTKLFHEHTGQSYTVDIKRMVQINNQTKFERCVRRVQITSLADEALIKLSEQRAKAVKDAEQASFVAVQACEKASFEELKTTHMLERAQERVKGADIALWVVPRPGGEEIGLEKVPMQWGSMGDATYMEVEMMGTPGLENELNKVVSFFLKSSPNLTVVSVKRIQNLLLWNLYSHARKVVSAKKLNKGSPNEEYLWHGPGKVADALKKIICSGCDEKFSTCTPQGIWLSTNSAYSVNGYCVPCPGGTKKLFLMRCILGFIGQIVGKSQLQQVNGEFVDSHHCGGTSSGHTRKDEQTGGNDNRYVINRNNQLYPAYVIEFR